MEIRIDVYRARSLAGLLHARFLGEGIFGQTRMPEDHLPPGVSEGSPRPVLEKEGRVAPNLCGDRLPEKSALFRLSAKILIASSIMKLPLIRPAVP